MRDAVRVALLARPGAGADRLRDALRTAGAEVVLDADPTTVDPGALAGSGAGSVVVVLDAAVEDALERLDAVLHDPAIDVLYEESAVAAAREGWDAARWARHLSAKLQRHDDVLPPGREPDDAMPAAVGPAPPAAPAAPAAPAEPAAPAAPAGMSPFDPVAAEFDGGAAPPLEPPLELPAMPDDDASPPTHALGEVDADFDIAPEPDAVGEPEPAPEPEPAGEAAPTPGAALEFTLDPPAPPAPAGVPAADTTPRAPVPGDRSDVLRDFRRDLAGLEERIASMSLVGDEPPADAGPPARDEAPIVEPESAGPAAGLEPAGPSDEPVPAAPAAAPAAARGAVLVFAGIGGPDAIRQFLGALPEAFPRPVLIHQRLDGGRHDRLVQQMARATSLPVQLAVDGEGAAPGHVYILPPGLGLDDATGGLRFVAGADPMDTLPPDGSAVLMFSGSDTALVDAAMGHAGAGAMVAGQSPQDCYDAAAADALVSRGAESGQPAELARRLAERWAA